MNMRVFATLSEKLKINARVDSLILLIGLLASWQVLSWLIGIKVLPAPATTARQLMVELQTPGFADHVWATAKAFGVALIIAITFGIAFGMILGVRRIAGEVSEPILITLYSIPKIALYPVILLMFGLDISARIAFGVIHGVIPIIIFTMTAVRNMPSVYLRSAQSFRLKRRAMIWEVLIPAALPEIVAGLRIGFSLTLLGTLLGEMFASQHGIGNLLMRAMERNETTTIMALAVLLLAVAVTANYGLVALDKIVRRS